MCGFVVYYDSPVWLALRKKKQVLQIHFTSYESDDSCHISIANFIIIIIITLIIVFFIF